jgi:hypothetical protein
MSCIFNFPWRRHPPKTKRPRPSSTEFLGRSPEQTSPQGAARGWQPRMAPVQESAAVRPNLPTPELPSGRQAVEGYLYLGARGMARSVEGLWHRSATWSLSRASMWTGVWTEPPDPSKVCYHYYVSGNASGPRPAGVRPIWDSWSALADDFRTLVLTVPNPTCKLMHTTRGEGLLRKKIYLGSL